MSIVIVGSGIAGLYSAYLAKSQFPDSDVIVLERDSVFGGLLKSFYYPDYGFFDVGTHMIFETGHKSIDEFLFLVNPEFNWNTLDGDWSGTYWNKVLNLKSPYLDINSLPENEKNIIIGEAFSRISDSRSADAITAESYFKLHFGPTAFKEIYEPILKKLFNREDISSLSSWGAKLFPFNRFLAFNFDEWFDLMHSGKFRSRFGFPDQYTLPSEFSNKLKGFYPQEIGLQSYIDSLVMKLKSMGIHFLNNSQVVKLKSNQAKIVEINYLLEDEEHSISNIDKIIWAAGLPAFYFSKISNIEIRFSLDKPVATKVVNVVLSSENILERSHYFYNFDSSHTIYRVTNYHAYTNCKIKGFKYSLELLTDENNPHILKQNVVNELSEIGMIKDESDIKFFAIESIATGIPYLSLRNLESMKSIRTQISGDKSFSNISFVGAGSSDGIFFQGDIMKDVHSKFSTMRND